ncbi:MAG: hypothetical protein ABI255_03455 [Microbacteriaceae bacterium]
MHLTDAKGEYMAQPDAVSGDSPVEVLQRWERGGAVWQVLSDTDAGLEIALMTCTRQEEVDRLVSADPALRAFVGTRTASDE